MAKKLRAVKHSYGASESSDIARSIFSLKICYNSQSAERGYVATEVHHVALETYLRENVPLRDRIDWMSMDIEGGEVELNLYLVLATLCFYRT